MFFKLSSVSPKDVILDDGNPTLKATSAERLFNVITKSFRILDELEEQKEDNHFALILSKWDDKIKYENEYRCFIFNGLCEAIAKLSDESEPDIYTENIINDFINRHKDKFPDSTVALDISVDTSVQKDKIKFIEFNPVDDELDTCGILKRDKLLSPFAMLALSRNPEN